MPLAAKMSPPAPVALAAPTAAASAAAPSSAVGPAKAKSHVIRMRITAYCPCPICCGKWADRMTASGRPVTTNRGRFVAADTGVLPFGTQVSVPGYHGGQKVPVWDRGCTIKGNRLDVFFPSHQRAKEWGVKYLPVTIYDN
jgi:3D (Asp-Asp-Asp) domain-containing protein